MTVDTMKLRSRTHWLCSRAEENYADCRAAADEIDALRDERDRLIEALQPFAGISLHRMFMKSTFHADILHARETLSQSGATWTEQ